MIRRPFVLAILAASFLAAAVACRAEVEPFTFVHISDSHLKTYYDQTKAALEDIRKNYPDAAFIIHTGDVTEFGYNEEFTSYTEAITSAPAKVYQIPGNHDTRWSEGGKENFRTHCGPNYVKFRHNGVTFILMDVSMLIEQYGHFEGVQMDQLKRDLESLREDEPVVIAIHHPALYKPSFIDNEYEFAETIRDYNVPLVLMGHGHGLRRYTINNTAYCMGGATSGNNPKGLAYRVYRVTPERIDFETRYYGEDRKTTETSVPLVRPTDTIGSLVSRRPAAAMEDALITKFALELDSDVKLKSATYTLDKWLTGTASLVPKGVYAIDTETLPPGEHQLVAEVIDEQETTHVRTCYFRTRRETLPAGPPEYGVVVAADLSRRRAAALRRQLMSDGFMPVEMIRDGRTYSVIVGESLSEESAKKLLHSMTASGYVARITSTFTDAEETTAPPAPHIGRVFDLNSGCQSHPVIADNTLFVAANDQFLRAIDLKSGKVAWQRNLKKEILSSPAVTTESVVIGSLDGRIYCLGRDSGETNWEFETSGSVLASPLVVDNTVYIGSGDYHMYALDLKSGAMKWRFPAGKLIKATPAYAKGRLFFGAWDGQFYCLDAATGSLMWQIPIAKNGHFSAATCNPLATDDKIIVVTHDYCVRCLDQASGAHLWMYRPAKDELGPSYSSPVLRNGVVYMGSIKGCVVGFEVETGRKVLDIDLRPSNPDPLFDSIPLVDENLLYVGSVGGNLYCVDLDAKKLVWTVALQPGYIFARPAKWNDSVLVGSMNDKVYEISLGHHDQPEPEPQPKRKVRRAKQSTSDSPADDAPSEDVLVRKREM